MKSMPCFVLFASLFPGSNSNSRYNYYTNSISFVNQDASAPMEKHPVAPVYTKKELRVAHKNRFIIHNFAINGSLPSPRVSPFLLTFRAAKNIIVKFVTTL